MRFSQMVVGVGEMEATSVTAEAEERRRKATKRTKPIEGWWGEEGAAKRWERRKGWR